MKKVKSRLSKKSHGLWPLDYYQALDRQNEAIPITDLTREELLQELAHCYDLLESASEIDGLLDTLQATFRDFQERYLQTKPAGKKRKSLGQRRGAEPIHPPGCNCGSSITRC